MEVVRTVAAARDRRRVDRGAGRRVALVPTMGALHDGHLSLVRRAGELADSVWASVFVNPAQFGPGEDFERYPRDLDRDLGLLESAGAAVVFAPETAEMYPRPPVVSISFEPLDRTLCGAHRPGHFAGVGLVVSKLLHIVEPDVAVFGQKDAQQALLIRRLVTDLDFPVEIEVAPTVREADGVAMSSRNALLGPDDRRAAPALFHALETGRRLIESGERDPAEVEAAMRRAVEAEPRLELDYARCVDREDLSAPATVAAPVLLAVAARVGGTRLIDNLPVDPPPES